MCRNMQSAFCVDARDVTFEHLLEKLTAGGLFLKK